MIFYLKETFLGEADMLRKALRTFLFFKVIDCYVVELPDSSKKFVADEIVETFDG